MPRDRGSRWIWTITTAIAAAALGLAMLAGGSLAATPAAKKANRCGYLKAEQKRYLILGDHSRCHKARYVIRYVLTHGRPTLTSPGRPPRRWGCDFSYGKDAKGNVVKAGPACERGPHTVAGFKKGLKPDAPIK